MAGIRIILNIGTAVLTAVLLVVSGCGQRKAETFYALPFPAVSIPSVYEDDYEMAVGYLAEHYWDDFTDTSRHYPCDSVFVSGVKTDDVEAAFSNYVGLLGMLDLPEAMSAMDRLFDRVASCERSDTVSNVFETVTALVEKYLYDPNSPFRNEDLYFPYAERLSFYEGFSAEKKAAYGYDARMCSMNRTGSRAADFTFVDADGMTYSLYGIDSEYTLLFFSNPGCAACKNIINVLSMDLSADSLISDGTLSIVNIYIDEDISGWYEYMPVYPESWYNGYDPDGIIRTDNLYNVRAIPSLYLLDREKNVLMKDAPEQNVFAFLENLNE